MENPFDQFDEPSSVAESNPFDIFDAQGYTNYTVDDSPSFKQIPTSQYRVDTKRPISNITTVDKTTGEIVKGYKDEKGKFAPQNKNDAILDFNKSQEDFAKKFIEADYDTSKQDSPTRKMIRQTAPLAGAVVGASLAGGADVVAAPATGGSSLLGLGAVLGGGATLGASTMKLLADWAFGKEVPSKEEMIKIVSQKRDIPPTVAHALVKNLKNTTDPQKVIKSVIGITTFPAELAQQTGREMSEGYDENGIAGAVGGATSSVAEAGYGLLGMIPVVGDAGNFMKGDFTMPNLREQMGEGTLVDTAVQIGMGFGAYRGAKTLKAGAKNLKYSGGVAIDKMIDKRIPFITRETSSGKNRYSDINRTREADRLGVKSIVEAKDAGALNSIDPRTGEAISALPKNLEEASKAAQDTAAQLFKEYNQMKIDAGESGVTVSTEPLIAELRKVANNEALAIAKPDVIKYAEDYAQRIAENGPLTPDVAQELIKISNQSYEAFLKNPSIESAGKAAVDAMIGNTLREHLNKVISEEQGPQYLELRRKYGAVSQLGKKLTKAAVIDARKNPVGLLDFTDMFSAGEVISGLVRMDPALMAKGGTMFAIKQLMKRLKDPNRAIDKMFSVTDKHWQRPEKPFVMPKGPAPEPTKPLDTSFNPEVTPPEAGAGNNTGFDTIPMKPMERGLEAGQSRFENPYPVKREQVVANPEALPPVQSSAVDTIPMGRNTIGLEEGGIPSERLTQPRVANPEQLPPRQSSYSDLEVSPQGNTNVDLAALDKALRDFGMTDEQIAQFKPAAMKLGIAGAIAAVPFLDDDKKKALGGLMVGSLSFAGGRDIHKPSTHQSKSTVPGTVYHATKGNISGVFSPDKGSVKDHGHLGSNMVYFYDKPEAASLHSQNKYGNESGQNIVPAVIKASKLYEMKPNQKNILANNPEKAVKFTEYLKKNGYDGSVIDHGSTKEYAIFPENAYYKYIDEVISGDLKPATLKNGVVKSAPIGKTHYDTKTIENNVKVKSEKAAGFITPNGEYIDRKQALNWLKEHAPEVYNRLDEITKTNGLESTALSAATGKKSKIDSLADAFMKRHLSGR